MKKYVVMVTFPNPLQWYVWQETDDFYEAIASRDNVPRHWGTAVVFKPVGVLENEAQE